MAVVPIYNPPLPYLGYIDGGFGPGRMVRIQGGISASAQRFAVNLQCGPNTNPRDDIALHLSPRFNENFITRSSLQNQSWSGEENHGAMPLARGQAFEILILCDQANYKIAINGQHFSEYAHRIPFSRVTHLTVDGDVSVNLIAFEGGYAPPPAAGHGVPGFGVTPPIPPAMPGMTPTPPMHGAAPYPPGGDLGYPKQSGMPYGQPGPMPGYGGQQMYGGGPYQPPGPQQYGGYGGYGGYGQPPPPPGYQQGKPSGGFLDKAGMALAGALGGAGVMGALGGKYPTIPQGHGDIGQGSMGGGSVGGLGSLGTLIGTGLAGAALSGVLGGKENPPTSTNPDNKPKNPSQNPPTTQDNSSSSGGLGYLGNLISPGLAGAIQSGLMGGPDRNAPSVHDRKYPNPAPTDPAAGAGGGLGSLGNLISSGLAGAIQSGIIGGQGRSDPNPYDRRSPYGYGGQGNYGGGQGNYGGGPGNYGGGQGNYGGGQGNYGGGQAGGLGSIGNLIGSGLAGAIQSGIFGGGGGGKEHSTRASLAYSSQDDKKPDGKSGGKIDEDLIRSLDELIVGHDDKPLNKTEIKFSDEAPIKSVKKSDVESEIEPTTIKAVDEPLVMAVKKEVVESVKETKIDDDTETKTDDKTKTKTDEPENEVVEEPLTKFVEEPITKTVVKAVDEAIIKPTYVP